MRPRRLQWPRTCSAVLPIRKSSESIRHRRKWTVGNKITLRSLFFVTALTAILLMVVRLAVLNQSQNVWVAIAVMVLIPVVTFGLFGLAFVMLLPFGIIAAMARESVAPGTSPFAEDRLPDKQIDVLDPERAN